MQFPQLRAVLKLPGRDSRIERRLIAGSLLRLRGRGKGWPEGWRKQGVQRMKRDRLERPYNRAVGVIAESVPNPTLSSVE